MGGQSQGCAGHGCVEARNVAVALFLTHLGATDVYVWTGGRASFEVRSREPNVIATVRTQRL